MEITQPLRAAREKHWVLFAVLQGKTAKKGSKNGLPDWSDFLEITLALIRLGLIVRSSEKTGDQSYSIFFRSLIFFVLEWIVIRNCLAVVRTSQMSVSH